MNSSLRTRIAIFLFVVVALVGRRVFSSVTSIPEIGDHSPLIRVEKNENRQNLMVVYTKLDPATCAFQIADGKPVFDEYWLMDGKKFKKVNPMIKSGIKNRFDLDQKSFENEKKFIVHLKDFNELKSDLGDSPAFEVKISKKSAACETEVVMQLGPSDKNRKMVIDSIYADSEKKLLPPFRKLKSLTLNGKDLVSGEVVHRTYNAN